MKLFSRTTGLLIAGLAFCQTAAPQAPTTTAPVLAQDLRQLIVASKVTLAMWTRRTDEYTLQLVYDAPRSAFLDKTRAELTGVEYKPWQPPQVQVWLLRPDGTAIGHERKQTVTAGKDPTPREALYSFTPSAARQASAIAVSIDGEYRVQQLLPFKD